MTGVNKTRTRYILLSQAEAAQYSTGTSKLCEVSGDISQDSLELVSSFTLPIRESLMRCHFFGITKQE